MSQSHSQSLGVSNDYTPQQFLIYLQSIKSFEQFDQSTLILQSHASEPATSAASSAAHKMASLHIRLTRHQHVSLHEFMADCMVIAELHNNEAFKSSFEHQHIRNCNESISTHIMSINHFFDLQTKCKDANTAAFLQSFYNAFLHFLSIVTQMFDESIVSTKLRIRGPYLLLSHESCMQQLSHFLLSQLTLIASSMPATHQHAHCYEMSMAQLKNLRYIISLMKQLLQFELFTLDYYALRQTPRIAHMLLFSRDAGIKHWSVSLAKLFGVRLMIKLPTHSLQVLSKFSTDKLVLLENKAVLTTKAFHVLLVKFVRFLIVHYAHHDCMTTADALSFNHLDVIMQQLFANERSCEFVVDELCSVHKLEAEFQSEYEIQQKYHSSAFLKDKLNVNNQRAELQAFESETECKEYMKEQTYILLMDKILPFCFDYGGFYAVLCRNNYQLFHKLLGVVNAMLLHFVDNEKWWYLSHVLSIVHSLFENKQLFAQYRRHLHLRIDGNHSNTNDEKARELNNTCLNLKYGIYTIMIWICYLHQFTPKPVITFFVEHNDDFARDAQTTPKRTSTQQANAEQMDKDMKVFETLPTTQRRISELYLAKSVLIQLMISMDEWLLDELSTHFHHIRDRYVLIKLLQTLLHDIAFLRSQRVLPSDVDYQALFVAVLHRFKHKMLCQQAVQSQQAAVAPHEARKPVPMKLSSMKSKIVFRKQAIPIKRVQVTQTANNSAGTRHDVKNKNTETIKDDGEQLQFEHFSEHSMKIVDCIIKNKKHLLHQFVSSKASSSSSSSPSSVKQPQHVQAKPPPPVFQPYCKPKPVDTQTAETAHIPDLSFLSSTLSSIQSALTVQNTDSPKQKHNQNQNQNQYSEHCHAHRQAADDDDDFDFEFDFQALSARPSVSGHVERRRPSHIVQGYHGGLHDVAAPPTKKRKVSSSNHSNDNKKKRDENENEMDASSLIGSKQLTDLLSFFQSNHAAK